MSQITGWRAEAFEERCFGTKWPRTTQWADKSIINNLFNFTKPYHLLLSQLMIIVYAGSPTNPSPQGLLTPLIAKSGDLPTCKPDKRMAHRPWVLHCRANQSAERY